MQKSGLIFYISLFFIITVAISTGCNKRWKEETKAGYNLIQNKGGKILAYSPLSGVKILTSKGLAFKDLNKNGTLDPYEDWRLSVDERAKDLASRLSVEQIAGLMLYSSHQAIPSARGGFVPGSGGTYGGKPYTESGAKASDLSDQQIKFLSEDNLRHVLITTVETPEVAAIWNNNAQSLVEGTGLGIPVNSSSDPRHNTRASAEYNAGSGGQISLWPGSLGIAATFDPQIMQKFGEIASVEYRALGISTALSPQIDLATEPRWSRFNGTLGEDPDLAADMARAYVDGFQTSEPGFEIDGGWGYHSVNAMVKHWPGGGPEEGGRDAHYGYGEYAVYPGNNLKDHLKPFTDGAFKLNGPTVSAAAVMPYYTISYDQDKVYGENVGNSYSKYLITDLLRRENNYDGVVCTDWMITKDVSGIDIFEGKCWGVENLTEPERHYKAIMAGVDQFGGNNEMGPVIDAYQEGVREHGEEFMKSRFEGSAIRLLRNIFRVGLFENPYLDPEESKNKVGSPEFMKTGYDTQIRSIVMLKNQSKVLPVEKRLKVYLPKKHNPAGRNRAGEEVPESWSDPMNMTVVSRYFEVTDNPEFADFAIVCISSPAGGSGYSRSDLGAGGNGYVPITLQYGKYKADYARSTSIAGGSPFENFTNRSYKGKTSIAANSEDMEMVTGTRQKMGKKPVIVAVNVSNPMVFGEIEKYSSAILVHFGVQDQALLDIISGEAEPSGLLPFQMPSDMKTVEEQMEDVPEDMKCYTDSDGNTYDFGFGMNWNGAINDERTRRYRKVD